MSEHISSLVVRAKDEIVVKPTNVVVGDIQLPLIVGEDFKNEWRPWLSNEDYHADKTAVSSTGVRAALKSRANFHANYVLDGEKEETDAMRFGSLFHMAALEPALFRKKVVYKPKFDLRTTKGKNGEKEFMANLPEGAIICKEDEAIHLYGMAKSILEHEDAFNAIKGGTPEISGYYRDPRTGLLLKIRMDILNFMVLVIADVKTARECSWKDFKRTVKKDRLDVQLIMYEEGFYRITGERIKYSGWIVIEKKPPYEVKFFEVDQIIRETGLKGYNRGIDRIVLGLKEQAWPMEQKNAELVSFSMYDVEELEGLDDHSKSIL